jgi:hypothetical protein
VVAAEAAAEARRAARLKEGERLVGKEIRRRAFRLARQRYEEVWPTLAELAEMEAAQREQEAELARRAEEEAAARKAKKGGGGGRR